MKCLDLTFATPAENLACDEALLDLCEEAGVETLRFWESHEPFVVVGYGNRIEREVNVEECRRRAVPILRRCSGGGTVLQGPGCLNYNLTLRIPSTGPLMTVTGTNEFVMEQNRAAMESLLGVSVSVKGHTDLAFEAHALDLNSNPYLPTSDGAGRHWLKFSGNAQRRRREALVFHGTILHSFDLSLIDALLRFPTAQPEYRAGRSHTEFVRNVVASPAALRAALRSAWNVDGDLNEVPHERIQILLREHYLNEAWVFRPGA